MCKTNCEPGEGCFFASQVKTQKSYLFDQVNSLDQTWLFLNFPEFLSNTRDLMIENGCHELAFTAVLLAYQELKVIQKKYQEKMTPNK